MPGPGHLSPASPVLRAEWRRGGERGRRSRRGRRFMEERRERQGPGAGGINGCLSGVRKGLAGVLNVEGGFVMVMMLAEKD